MLDTRGVNDGGDGGDGLDDLSSYGGTDASFFIKTLRRFVCDMSRLDWGNGMKLFIAVMTTT